MTLAEDLQKQKISLQEFESVTRRILEYLPNVIDEEKEYRNYKLCASNIANTRKQIRPFNHELFLQNVDDFTESYNNFYEIVQRLKNNDRVFNDKEYQIVDKTVYTIQQALGIGLDLLVNSNSARKHVGNRFEELIRVLFSAVGISLKKVVISIPYPTEEGEKFYKCETDIVISPYNEVKSNSQSIDENEIVISLKTTTKDRMPKIFIDKILLERFLEHPVKVVGISQNDIQRKGNDKISSTFVSNLFMVYTRFLVHLEGYYYLDRPLRSFEEPFNQYISPFSKFLINDVWELFGT